MSSRIVFLAASLLWCVVLPACSQPPGDPPAKPDDPAASKVKEERVSFEKDIRPLLSNKCTICHNAKVLALRPYFETAEGATKSGMIVAGDPGKSRMLAVVKEGPFDDKAMPPVSHRLTPREISVLRAWIAQGAEWPKGEAGRVKPAFIPKE